MWPVHCFCPPFTHFNQVTGTLVPIDVSVNIGKEKSAVPTYPNNFIVKAATSVRTDGYICEHRSGPCASVPKEAVLTNLLVQICSVGPVPPSIAAATNAAAEPSAQKYLADGDQTLLKFSPLTTVTTLEY